MFKLGRFSEAEVAYTSAISQLPDSHLLLVPLLNNRGLSRLKTGNVSGAIEDCTTVIAILGPSYHPAREAKVTREEDGAGVDLGDGLIKAWRRRAEAYEGKEKWDLARQDWESIAGADFAGRHRSEALSGIGRCRKVQNIGNALDSAAPSVSRVNAPRPTTRPPPRRGPTPPSEAVTRLKQANQEAEAEEQARLELKDSVDSRVAGWKNGKETNLRALVASLDTVLWPELGWQKVGMAELVTPHQVKIRYTKAIAKLHPDKVRRSCYLFPHRLTVVVVSQLNVKNTTLEQRMIANGVFGALNDAWNAFKP
jgi:tetratricopeptide (TPR) repeat protein